MATTINNMTKYFNESAQGEEPTRSADATVKFAAVMEELKTKAIIAEARSLANSVAKDLTAMGFFATKNTQATVQRYVDVASASLPKGIPVFSKA